MGGTSSGVGTVCVVVSVAWVVGGGPAEDAEQPAPVRSRATATTAATRRVALCTSPADATDRDLGSTGQP